MDSLERRKRAVHVVAFPDVFLSEGTRDEILEDLNLSPSSIAEFVLWNI